jgi:hypothetical protein
MTTQGPSTRDVLQCAGRLIKSVVAKIAAVTVVLAAMLIAGCSSTHGFLIGEMLTAVKYDPHNSVTYQVYDIVDILLHPIRAAKPELYREDTASPTGTHSTQQPVSDFYTMFIGQPTTLCDAASRGSPDKIKELLAEGEDVNSQCWGIGMPLHAAVLFNRRSEAADVLLSNGADVNAKDVTGRTPLHQAVMEADLTMVQVLLRYGAEVNVKDPSDRTPLHEAVIDGHAQLVWLILAYRGEVNAKDEFERTPLHWAAHKTGATIVRHLLAAGAAVNVVDADGNTPLDLATDPKVLELLKQRASGITAAFTIPST